MLSSAQYSWKGGTQESEATAARPLIRPGVDDFVEAFWRWAEDTELAPATLANGRARQEVLPRRVRDLPRPDSPYHVELVTQRLRN